MTKAQERCYIVLAKLTDVLTEGIQEKQKKQKEEKQKMTMEQFYSVQEIASSLRLPETTILKWIRDGKLGGVKCGRSYRISETQFEEFLQENAIGKPFDASAKTAAAAG